jgi:hypothetical protein
MRRTAMIVLTLALAACGKGENAPGPGGVTQGEARALDEAAAMIEERRLPVEALAPTPPSASATPSPAVQ